MISAIGGLSPADWRTVLVYVLIGVLTAAILWVIPKIAKGFRMLTQMHGDFVGEQARPGIAARPGVMERLESQDVVLADVVATVRKIEDELPKNGVPVAVKLDRLWAKYLTDEERSHS